VKIKIIACGREKEKDFKEYEEDLKRRISPFAKLSLVYVSKETEFHKHIPKDKFFYLLDVKGKEVDSYEFAKFLDSSEVVFLVGPPDGFSKVFRDKVEDRATVISLSRLTFPHRLCKLILLEQIYRGFCIQKNLPYAK